MAHGRKSWHWRRLLVVVLGAVAVWVLGMAFLFTGTEVSCEELVADGGGPELRCVFTVAAAPEAVWQAFTTTGEPQRHYFDAVLETENREALAGPEGGQRNRGRWRFVTGDRQRLLAGGEILAFEPPKRFAQTFRAADLDDAPSRITVEIEAQAKPPGCRVSLAHDRFERKTTTYRRFRRAHPLALSALKAVVETGELPVRARIYTLIFKPGMNLVSARAEPWSG